jgi:GxxExxY protein
MEERDKLTETIIGLCFEIHRQLGPGYLERIYVNALKLKLRKANINFEIEREFIVNMDGEAIGKFRCDFLVEKKVIIELKSVVGFQPKIFQSQLISYLKASKIKTGLLINFGNTSCEIKRLSV